jgi:phosphoglycerate dehydrogenase-like enzyme
LKRCFYSGTLSLPPELKPHFEENSIELTENPLGHALSEDELLTFLPRFDAALAGPEPYTERVIAACPNLKIIARTGVGYDKVDVEAASRRGIYVTWTPIPELSYAIAEQTFALILSFIKRIPHLNQSIREGKWDRAKWSKEIENLYPKTLGLLGLGRIGAEVARRAKSHRMSLIYYDSVRMLELEEELGIRYTSLDELLSTADIISIHVPLTPATRGLINDRTIRKMKTTAIIVNTARGAIIDEQALAQALKERRLGGALLDVLSEEPPSETNVFFKLGERFPNLVITPHVAQGPQTLRAMTLAAADDIIRVLDGRTPRYLLNKDTLEKHRM